MMIVFLTSLFPHYYSWWGYINYYNDSFYSQWYHQMFFTVTECVSSGIVLYLIDLKHFLTHRKLLIVLGISLVHVYCSSIDQFVQNVLWQRGHVHQVCIFFYCLIIIYFITILSLGNQRLWTNDTRYLSYCDVNKKFKKN